MPSFDIVVKADAQELRNAIDQAQREVTTRYDLKDTGTLITQDDAADAVTIESSNEFYVETASDILTSKLIKRGVDPLFLDPQKIEVTPNGRAKRVFGLKNGIPQDLAKQIVKRIKEMKVKAQPAIRGDEIRISGKKRDELQAVIQELKSAEFDRPLSFSNFRD